MWRSRLLRGKSREIAGVAPTAAIVTATAAVLTGSELEGHYGYELAVGWICAIHDGCDDRRVVEPARRVLLAAARFPSHHAFPFPPFCSQPPPAPPTAATPAGAHSAGSISARRRWVAADPEGEGGGRLYYSTEEDLRLVPPPPLRQRHSVELREPPESVMSPDE
uniref:Uncharacterized protein n=1 Tax=Leersia perrieri TaxID=77586 RepID=A0A0D9VYI2_9ORYZ